MCRNMNCENAVFSFIAEVFGTAILMFVGCSGAVDTLMGTILLPAFSFGIAVLIAVHIFINISGAHLNPAVSVGVLILGKITVIQFLYYVLAQFLGALLGYSILYLLLPSDLNCCVLHLTDEMTPLQGMLMEACATGTLVFFVASLMDDRNTDTDSVAVRVGLVILGLVITAGPFTGAALNPARTLPPALLNNEWQTTWIYYAGPMLGGAVAALLYRFVIDQKEKYNLVKKVMGICCNQSSSSSWD